MLGRSGIGIQGFPHGNRPGSHEHRGKVLLRGPRQVAPYTSLANGSRGLPTVCVTGVACTSPKPEAPTKLSHGFRCLIVRGGWHRAGSQNSIPAAGFDRVGSRSSLSAPVKLGHGVRMRIILSRGPAHTARWISSAGYSSVRIFLCFHAGQTPLPKRSRPG